MKYISHRGNLLGKNVDKENSIEYIDQAIFEGYDVEIDLWKINEEIYLGHDYPQYKINIDWLIDRKKILWCHAKNIEILSFFRKFKELNYFWHQNDDYTLTSHGYIWAFPGKVVNENSIVVLPEINKFNFYVVAGICSDQIKKYKEKI